MWSDDVVVTGARRRPGAGQDLGAKRSSPGRRRHHRPALRVLDREFFDTGFVQQHILHATSHGPVKKVALRVWHGGQVGRRHGLIRRIDEYPTPPSWPRCCDDGWVTMTALQLLLADLPRPGSEPGARLILGPVPGTRRCGAGARQRGVRRRRGGDGQITAKGAVFGRVDVRAASVKTGTEARRAPALPDFFDADAHPEISVVVTDVTPTGRAPRICAPS